MSIILKRKQEFTGSMVKLNVKINGEKIGKIVNGEEKEIDLPKAQSTLQVNKLVNGKSKEIPVRDGDIIEFSNASWRVWEFLILVILMSLISSLSGITWVTGLIVVVVLYLLFMTVIHPYKLTKKNRENTY